MFSSRVPIVRFLKFGLIEALKLFNVEEKIFIYSLESSTSKSFSGNLKK